MTLYKASFSLSDDFTRVTTRSFLFEAADFTNASTLMAAFTPLYQAATKLWLFESRLTEEEAIGGSAVSGANVDAGMSISAQLDTPGKKANIQVPDPVAAIINSDGTIDLADAIMTALLVPYTQATPYVTASDGEKVTAFLKGTLDK